ncbi:hypothetical protein K435DRAFT_777403 [Dendrothele bispora CBS 962.96]|uniref:Uncharacterized protein n=1 Tax=Dendrothele bispora (strain CBS 962.96) TaxID=1314807 RepID=A0A4S8M937_DENBC|nr:hypothetical protein K435DRAFT_777403 [Dendrothele bispora CBS 962.96]
MSWGGMLFSHLLLSLPPPALVSIHPYINYLSVHLLFTGLFYAFPGLLDIDKMKTYDLVLFPIDALLRVNAITSTVGMLSSSPSPSPSPQGNPNYARIHPALVDSPLFHLILGAVASAGGSVTASTFSTFTPNWSFSTPVFLRPGVGLLGTMDIWGGALIALVFGVSSGHKAFRGVVPGWVERLVQVHVEGEGEAKTLVLSQKGAKALGALVLTVLFGYRAVVGWVGAQQQQQQVGKVEASKKMQGAKKKQ